MTLAQRRCGRAAAAVLVVAAAAAASSEVPGSGAFRVENAEVDLGRVIAGSEASAVFVFHNDGDRDVRILRAAPS